MIFTDTQGNVVPDIEHRIALPGLIRALLDNGTLRPEDVTNATEGRIIAQVEPEVVAYVEATERDDEPTDPPATLDATVRRSAAD